MGCNDIGPCAAAGSGLPTKGLIVPTPGREPDPSPLPGLASTSGAAATAATCTCDATQSVSCHAWLCTLHCWYMGLGIHMLGSSSLCLWHQPCRLCCQRAACVMTHGESRCAVMIDQRLWLCGHQPHSGMLD